MNARLAIAAITASCSLFASAQNVIEDPKVDPVLDAISEFNNRDKEKHNEVTVVLDPVGQPPAEARETPTVAKPIEEKAKMAEPILVTGKPQEGSELAPVNDAPSKSSDEEIAPADETPKPQQGLAVRIEKMQTGKGLVDPKQIKLLAPFPAKPLAKAPAGWHLVSSDSAPPFTRKVELAPGSEVTLTIRPHLLVPDADGTNVFSIPESGYNPSLGYQQTSTVGAILSNSIRQLDDESKQLGSAIDNLQQLLISLPKTEAPPEAKPIIAPLPARKR